MMPSFKSTVPNKEKLNAYKFLSKSIFTQIQKLSTVIEIFFSNLQRFHQKCTDFFITLKPEINKLY